MPCPVQSYCIVLWCYARAMQCAVLKYGMVLRARCVVSYTDKGYGATRRAEGQSSGATAPDTRIIIAYVGMLLQCSARVIPRMLLPGWSEYQPRRVVSAYATPSTDVGYGPTGGGGAVCGSRASREGPRRSTAQWYQPTPVPWMIVTCVSATGTRVLGTELVYGGTSVVCARGFCRREGTYALCPMPYALCPMP
eukprot:3941987-Rhodomonas_salina.2